jgi:NTP pyrophosphatase (non-canonical NTP hydrolase)
MTLNDYQAAARRTRNTALAPTDLLVDAAAGLAEEAGEVLGIVRKHAFQQFAVDREHATKELGDVLWCLATVADALGVTLDEVAETNLAKLRRRYPDGFSVESSRTRTGDE